MSAHEAAPGFRWAAAVLGTVLVAAGCGGAGGSGTTTATAGTTTATAGTTTATAGTTTAATASSTPADATPSAASSEPNASPTPPRRTDRLVRCTDVVFGAATEDMATRITAAGATCAQATSLIRAVAARHNFVSGPRRFSNGGYHCRVRTDETGLPTGFYVCTRDGVVVTWTKT